jgi:hypothetical protein
VNPIAPKLFLSHAAAEMSFSLENLSAMKRHRAASPLENLWLFKHWPLRSQMPITALSTNSDLEFLVDILWNLSLVYSTLSRLRYTAFHRTFVGLLSESLLRIEKSFSVYIHSVTQIVLSKDLLERQSETVESAWSNLRDACQNLLIVYAEIRKNIQRFRLLKHEENQHKGNISQNSNFLHPDTHFNDSSTCTSESYHLDTGNKDPLQYSHAPMATVTASIPANANEVSSDLQKYKIPFHAATEVFQQSFFLFSILDLCRRSHRLYYQYEKSSEKSKSPKSPDGSTAVPATSSVSDTGEVAISSSKFKTSVRFIFSCYPLSDFILFLQRTVLKIALQVMHFSFFILQCCNFQTLITCSRK